ncbi:helix-turn-helix transcriptional regulator [Lacrimispora defluvii]|uniref:YafY family transcriptional regulator n=1 Tax=Lacrimispora defluvii TaxID=2719233 RepID=A0ABX1VRU3_9FIRM|nr:YafY family protein [Lacrimispora defluvii]NNJ30006.1 YafY family transcriptional regulator [Lacrimispora defluvii]
MKKTERQNGIIHLLRIRRKMTAKELADYFEVSERTIYRDIDALSQLRVPIISYEGLGGGYEIDFSYFMPSIKLSEQEILMLLMVLKAGEEFRIPNMAADYNLLSSKLLNVLPDEERQKASQVLSHINFDILRIIPMGYADNVLKPILEALWNSCDLQLSYYHPERNDTESRRFSPLELQYGDGGWYINGYCHLRKEKRTFRLDRIESVTCLNEKNHFINRELPVAEHDKFRWNTYELMLDPSLYRIIKDDVYLQNSVTRSIDNKIHLTVRTPYKDEICKLVLCHPEKVTALKPEEFMEEIKQLSNALSGKYQTITPGSLADEESN